MIIRYMAVGILIAVAMAVVAAGQGLIGKIFVRVLDRQPAAGDELRQTAMIGLALAETTAIICLVSAFLLLLSPAPLSCYGEWAEALVVVALAIPATTAAFSSAVPVAGALEAIAENPSIARRAIQLMMVMQSVIQSSVIFGFVISLLIMHMIPGMTTVESVVRCGAAAAALALGSIGSTLGLSRFAHAVCVALRAAPHRDVQIASFVFVGQAFISTPLLFALSASLLMLFAVSAASPIVFCAAACAVGLGTAAPGYASGYVAASAVRCMALYGQQASSIVRASLLAQALIDTNGIYALIISLGMLLGM